MARAQPRDHVMSHDRVTQLRISGMRVIEDLTLDVHGLTVLIGDNGTGKSTILEALELLRMAATPVSFIRDVVEKARGGLRSILRRGADELRIGVTIEGAGPKLGYRLALGFVGATPQIRGEWVDVYDDLDSAPFTTFVSQGTASKVFENAGDPGEPGPQVNPYELALPWLGKGASTSQLAFRRIVDALSRIEVHVPFETRPLWQQHELEIRVGPRWPCVVEQSTKLSRYALNLPNAFQQLRNMSDEVWERVLTRARMGLGDDVRNFRLTPFGRGNIGLELVLGSAPDKPLPAEDLSEGQLAYLAFLALVELDTHRSMLAFDEPEVHLHPALLTRVVWMLEEASRRAPVVISTHSDRLLDALTDPLGSVVLCDLDEHRAARLRRPNAERLADWLEDYRGIGSLRAEGYEAYVFDAATDEDGKP
jgi:predicted ATPase